MANSSDLTPPEPPGNPPPSRSYAALLLKAGVGVGAVVAAGSVVGTLWGSRIINTQVLPRVEAEIADTIDRPIDLGDVERWSLTGVQLGKTIVPPTATDESSVTVDRISVGIDLRSLLFQKTLKPTVVLVRPDVSLVQDKEGQWLDLSLLEPSGNESPITTEIQSIKVKDARLRVSTLIQDPQALVPVEPIEVNGADITANFYGEDAKQVYFDLTGTVDTGTFAIEGEGDLDQQAVKADVQVSKLPTTGVNLVLPSLLGLKSGNLDTNLTVAAALTEDGTLDATSVDVQGTAQFHDGEVLIRDLAKPIDAIRSQLRFKGQQVTLDDTALQVADMSLVATGTADWQDGYDLTAQISDVTLANVQALVANLELPEELPVDPTTPFELTTQITGALADPRLQGRLTNVDPVQVDKLNLATVTADFVLPLSKFELTAFELTELRLVPDAGGVILAQGQADLTDLEKPEFELTAQADIPVDALMQPYGVTLPASTAIGSLTANVEADGTLETQTAVAQWQLSDSSFPGQGELTFADNQLVIRNTRIQPAVGGLLVADGAVNLTDLANPSFELAAQADLPLDTLAQTYGVALPKALSPETTLGLLAANVSATGTLTSPTAVAQWQLSDSSFPGQGALTFVDNQLLVENTQLQVAGGLVTAAANAQLGSGDWQATVTTDQVNIGQFTPQAQGLLSSNLDAAGNLYALDLAKIEARGEAAIANAQINVPNLSNSQVGTLAAANAPLLTPGDWATQFAWQGDQIAVDYFTAPGIRADGTIGVDLTQPIPIGDLALNVALDNIDLAPFNRLAPTPVQTYGQLTGFTSFDGQITGNLTSPQLSGHARLNELALNEIQFEPLAGPVVFSLQDGGSVDLMGQQDRLQLALNHQLLPVAFEVRNQYQADNPNPDTNPNGLTQQAFVLTGRGDGTQLNVDIIQFPLDRLNIQPATAYGFNAITGQVNGSATLHLADLTNPSASGNLTVTQPALNPIIAETIAANFNYEDGVASLNRGELVIKDSRYALTGSVILTPELEYDGTLTVEQGRIEDLIALLDDVDLSHLPLRDLTTLGATAADLAIIPDGLPADAETDLLAAVVAARDRRSQQKKSQPRTLVDFSNLSGNFTGDIALAGHSLPPKNVTVDIDIRGENWQWQTNVPTSMSETKTSEKNSSEINNSGNTTLETNQAELTDLITNTLVPNNFVIDATFTSDRGFSSDPQQITLHVDDVTLNAGKTQIALEGKGTLNQLNGLLTVQTLPVELINLIYPVPVAGNLDLSTQFRGSLADPTIDGILEIKDPQINDYTLDQLTADFAYNQATFAVDGKMALDATDKPVTLKGTVPYKLPLTKVEPPRKQLDLTAIVPSDNFDIINTVTQDQVRWEEGHGEIVVNIGGPLTQPTINSKVRLRDGVIASEFLADPVTNLTGDIEADLTPLFGTSTDLADLAIPVILGQVKIPKLQASLKDGHVTVDGTLPISLLDRIYNRQTSNSQDDDSITDGITIDLQALPINYSGILKSVFDGKVTLDGSILMPIVGGNLDIGEGKISVDQLLRNFRAAPSLAASDAEVEAENNGNADNNVDGSTEDDAATKADESPISRQIRAQMENEVALYRERFLGEDSTIAKSDALPLGWIGQLVTFDNLHGLQVSLSDRLLIEGQPIFNLRASGDDITIRGSLSNPELDGEIALKSGWINFFSTQFRLDTSEDNTATFKRENGIYPILNVAMKARVQERDVARVPAVSEGIVSSEVTDTQNADALGDVQYINIQASVADLNVKEIAQGSIEDIQTAKITLESVPSRSEGALVALLTNNVLGGLTNAGLTQVAGFVGAGSVVGFVNNLADTLGFESFSVFPTTDTSTESTAGIGIGIEATFAITDDIKVSILEILNNGNAPQLGLQYELTDELRLRGSSNLDDTEIRLEYRLEF